MDLPSEALDAEKLVVLVPTCLDVDLVELQLVPIATGNLNR
jgi:hypothetical protein